MGVETFGWFVGSSHTRLGAVALACVLAGACATSSGAADAPGQGADGSGATAGAGSGGDGGLAGDPSTDPIGQLSGVVLAPEGTIPISGALVYLTNSEPPPIPSGVFCDRCVELDEGTPHAFSAADGSFELPVHATGDRFLVTQKGSFRRVRPLHVGEGATFVPESLTKLPGQAGAHGDTVPRIAIVQGIFDEIEVSLGKLGLRSYDLYDEAAGDALLSSREELDKYHIVFLPCSSQCGKQRPQDPVVQDNLRGFVRAGGRLYTTDFSYEYLRNTWPGVFRWEYEKPEACSAWGMSYDSSAAVDDDGLREWLAVQNIIDFDLVKNNTRILQMNEADVVDLDGAPIKLMPQTWMTSLDGNNPATVTMQDGCGRVLFSTYHTEIDESNGNLLPQERALLYVLLEVAVCMNAPIVR